MPSSTVLRREVVRVCRRLHGSGLIAGIDGNVSVRTSSGTLLFTPAGAAKVDVKAAALVETDMDGNSLGGGVASSEAAMHIRIYALRPDISAIVHAHPPNATALAVAGEGIPADILPEIATQFGEVPLVPYARSGTGELADAIAPFATRCGAFLMANHGATALGRTLGEAHLRMESLEHAAKIILLAKLAGRIQRLSVEETAVLRGLGC